MTVKELYDSIGGNYTGALELFMNEKIVLKFALKFKNDKSFQMLEAALAKKDWHEAFVAAHTLKGVAGNISFTKMHKEAAALTEQLRPEKEIDNMDLFNALKACYNDTIAKLNQFEMIQ